jgi:ABC-type multidrug transport system fused ATPase/permease subunit
LSIDDDKDIVEACVQSNADDFIRAFPERYDTDLGYGGMLVSGGQKQRIAIARALIKKPAVLLLDEATSALDTASERQVQQAIDALQRDRQQTTIVIAHRLSTIRNADKICVVKKGASLYSFALTAQLTSVHPGCAGNIVEMGSHEALLKCGGLYAELWGKQNAN